MNDYSEEAVIFSYLQLNNKKEEDAYELVSKHLREVKDKGLSSYLSFSGGKDSTAVAFILKDLGIHIPLCYFASDLDYPENKEYIEKIASTYKFDLHVIETESSQAIIDDVAFFQHYRDGKVPKNDLRTAKITNPAIEARNKFGHSVFWGLRADESNSRGMLLRPNKGQTFNKDLDTYMCAPLWNWSSMNISSYFVRRQIPINPIYKKLKELGVPDKEQRVGSFFDGNGLDFGRITWLKRGWPDIYEDLRRRFPRIEEYR